MLIPWLAVMSPWQGLDLGLTFLTAAAELFGCAVACLRSLWIDYVAKFLDLFENPPVFFFFFFSVCIFCSISKLY